MKKTTLFLILSTLFVSYLWAEDSVLYRRESSSNGTYISEPIIIGATFGAMLATAGAVWLFIWCQCYRKVETVELSLGA